MKSIITTGSAGPIGSESTRHFANDGFRVVGIDNDMRSRFFGPEASTRKIRDQLVREISQYERHDIDIRDASTVANLFAQNWGTIQAVVHTAAQPSHDWAARDPQTDFTVNANGTLNLLEAARQNCPEAPFVLSRRTRFTAIPRIACRCGNWKRAGRSRLATNMNAAFQKR